jgi:hypothetical protein
MDVHLTEDETNTLTVLPYLVGIAVALSGKSSPLGFLREMRVVEHVPELADMFIDNALVQTALTSRDHYTLSITPELVVVKTPWDDIKHRYTPDRLKTHVLALCGTARNILAQHPNTDEAEQYKCWVMAVADKVADAANEGGLFGIGREREAEHEQEMVAAIAATLGAIM